MFNDTVGPGDDNPVDGRGDFWDGLELPTSGGQSHRCLNGPKNDG